MKSSFPGLIFANRAPDMYYIRTTCLQQKIFLTDGINRGQLLELGSWDLRQRMEICSKILWLKQSNHILGFADTCEYGSCRESVNYATELRIRLGQESKNWEFKTTREFHVAWLISPKLEEWNGYEARETRLLYFCGLGGAQCSIVFLSFRSY